MGKMVESDSGGESGSVGASTGESFVAEDAGIGRGLFSEPRDLPSPMKTIDLGEFLDREPVHYNFKKSRISYKQGGEYRIDYGRNSGLYSGVLRSRRDPGLYRQSSDYVRGFSRVSGNSEGSESYRAVFRHNLN